MNEGLPSKSKAKKILKKKAKHFKDPDIVQMSHRLIEEITSQSRVTEIREDDDDRTEEPFTTPRSHAHHAEEATPMSEVIPRGSRRSRTRSRSPRHGTPEDAPRGARHDQGHGSASSPRGEGMTREEARRRAIDELSPGPVIRPPPSDTADAMAGSSETATVVSSSKRSSRQHRSPKQAAHTDTLGFPVPPDLVAAFLRVSMEVDQGPWAAFATDDARRERYVEFIELTRLGVPAEERARVWLTCSGAREAMDKVADVYDALVRCQKVTPSESTEQIEEDARVTFPAHQITPSLVSVLCAYAWKNEAVGYTRGMNFVAGVLVLVMPTDEQAFWVLSQIVESICPQYYAKNMVGIHVDTRVLDYLLSASMVDLHEHFGRLGLMLELVCGQWFVTLFAGVLPSESLLRAWDRLFVEGPQALFVVALGVLALSRRALLRCSSLGEAYPILRDAVRSAYDFEAVLRAASEVGCDQFSREMITVLRRTQLARTEKELGSLKHRSDVFALGQTIRLSHIREVNAALKGGAAGTSFVVPLKALQRANAEAAVEDMFEVLDGDRRASTVDYREVLAACAVAAKRGSLDDRLDLVWEVYEDGSGVMTREALGSLLDAFESSINRCMTGSKKQNEAFADKVFKNFDVSSQGHIERHEFHLAARAYPHLIECFLVHADEDLYSSGVGERAPSYLLSPEEALVAESLSREGNSSKKTRLCENVDCRVQ